jgi:hypothetical protein
MYSCFCTVCFFSYFLLAHNYIFFLNFPIEPELGAGIDPGIVFNPFPSNKLDETRLEPTTRPDNARVQSVSMI